MTCSCEKPDKTRWRVLLKNKGFNWKTKRNSCSESSTVVCLDCFASWRTKAKYVDELKDFEESGVSE